MGKTSQTFYIDNITSEAYLNQRLVVTEASQLNLFNKTVPELKKLFSTMEVFDSGEIRLKNYLGDFVTLEKE